MKINVCINGTFRYPQYIRHYEAAGVLNGFYFAHRPGTTGGRLGLRTASWRNNAAKEVLLQLAYRFAPSALLPRLYTRLGDVWQRDVIRHWRTCDSMEAVIGATADRVIAHARKAGTRVLGHPVMAHPTVVGKLVGEAYARLGLDPAGAQMTDLPRRLDEIAACDRLIVDSPFVAQSFSTAGVDPGRIAVVTPGVDLARFTPRTDEERDSGIFQVICVGLITPRKGQQILLEAWRMLKLPRAELVLVGLPGRESGAILRGSDGLCTHYRSIPNAVLRRHLARATVFVAPSVEDGFAQAPIEAMACGVPVIVTRNTGMSSLVAEGHDGFVVPALDAEALAVKLETLYRDRERAFAMGRNAATSARRHGSWSDYVDCVLDEHRHILGRSTAPGRNQRGPNFFHRTGLN